MGLTGIKICTILNSWRRVIIGLLSRIFPSWLWPSSTIGLSLHIQVCLFMFVFVCVCLYVHGHRFGKFRFPFKGHFNPFLSYRLYLYLVLSFALAHSLFPSCSFLSFLHFLYFFLSFTLFLSCALNIFPALSFFLPFSLSLSLSFSHTHLLPL